MKGEAAAPLERAHLRFQTALADDLNISSALAALFDFIREINLLCDANKLRLEDAKKILDQFEEWDKVLAVLPLHEMEEIPQELSTLLSEREAARQSRDFKKSDTLRDAIYARGYLIEDTPTGARLKKR